MTILTSLILIGAIVLVALAIAYNVQRGTKTLEELRANYYDNEAAQEVADLATELYNKELRPVAPRKTIKNIELGVEVTSEDITPQVIEKAVEIAKVLPEQATLNVEAIVDVVKPSKKKRKYHSKAPKGKA